MGTVEESADVWSRALAPRPFEFPRDHGAHEDFRIEWWYYTGNLAAEGGRQFGYQLTFFRTGVHPQPRNPSRWSVRDLYTAHFAISDIAERRHVFFQRNNRAGIGWAGAETERCHVWNGDWKLWLDGDAHRLVAQDGDCALDLTLVPAKPAILHGEQGLSRKGPSVGNASYYYSLTRLTTSGTLRTQDQVFHVQGESWMDHEFSSSFLEKGQTGWDWFSIQLDNGCELMLYQMRREDGSRDPLSSGTFIDERGQARQLASSDFDLQPAGVWQSPHTRAEYPLRWRIELPGLGYELQMRGIRVPGDAHRGHDGIDLLGGQHRGGRSRPRRTSCGPRISGVDGLLRNEPWSLARDASVENADEITSPFRRRGFADPAPATPFARVDFSPPRRNKFRPTSITSRLPPERPSARHGNSEVRRRAFALRCRRCPSVRYSVP